MIYRTFLSIFLAGFTAFLTSAAPIIMENFADPALFEVNTRFAKISGDGQTLEVDTASTKNSWNWIWRTKPGLLKPSTRYTATFRCRVEEPLKHNQFFHLLSRPFSADHPEFDTMRNNTGDSETFREVTLNFRTGEKSDYSFQIHTHNELRGAVTSLRLVETGESEKFIPAITGAAPYSGSVEPLPAGALEFEVERPRPHAGTTVKAADFGFSESSADNTGALIRAVEHCRKIGAAVLELAPGRYRMTAAATVDFRGLRDFTFDGKGAVLFFQKQGRVRNFRISECERVLLRNFSFDWDWEADPLASLVEVVRVAPGTIDFKFLEYEDFPRKDTRIAVVSSYDPATRSVGTEDGFDRSFEFNASSPRLKREWLAGNLLRLHAGNLNLFRPGQLFRMQHYYYDMDAIGMDANRHLTIEDVNIYSCAGHAFTVDGEQQYWQLRRVRIAPPAGTARRPITCTADHLHIARSRGFLKVEECEFSLGADDCINIHDCTGTAVKSGPNSIRTRKNANVSGFRAGAELELRNSDYSPTGFRSRIETIRQIEPGIREITFREEVPEPSRPGEPFVMFNWRFDSRNIIIRNNFFHDNRARGLLLLGRDITVENNHFRHNEMGAIKIETGYTFNSWSEGYGVSNVVIRNNRFDTVNPRGTASDGKARDIYIGVYMKLDPSSERTDYPILSDILFEGNTFRDSFGLIAFISSATNVTFRNNMFLNPTGRCRELPYRSAFFVTHSQNIKIVNNRYQESSHAPHPGVYYDEKSVSDLVVGGNTIISP